MKPEKTRIPDIGWSYFWIAAALVVLVALVNAPFMVADETNHFLRSVQISHGGFLGVKFSHDFAGGRFSQSVIAFSEAFGNMPFNPAVRASVAQMAAVYHDSWRGTLQAVPLSNTVIYPPQFYLPTAFALFVMRHLHMYLLECFYIARIFSGLVCVFISALALRLCAPTARPWLLFCLCFPEVLGLYASFSQDGPFIACAVLACALLTRVTGPRTEWRPREMALAAALLTLFVSAKPPYLSIMFLPLVLVERRYLRFTLGAVAIGVVAVLSWAIFGMHPLMTPTRAGNISPSGQIHYMLGHPGIVPVVLLNTFIKNGGWLVKTCISTISWVDAGMPGWFYVIFSILGLLLGLVYAVLVLQRHNRAATLRLLAVVVLVVGAGAGATLSTYLTWDEVGRDSAWGVLGRYFTPLVICLAPGAVFVRESGLAARAVPVAERALLYILLPFSGACYLVVLFLRFWWPV